MNYFFVYVFFLTKGVCAPGQPQAIAAPGIADQPASEGPFREEGLRRRLAGLFIRPLEEIVESLPARKGARHTFVDKSILLCLDREVALPFEAFVRRVDIAKGR